MSIGDSNDERLAVRAAAAPLDATAKAIKLVDAPSLDTVACQLVAVTAALPFLVAAKTSVDVDVAAVLAYVGAAHLEGDGGATDSIQRVWNDAAWGLLTAIRFQDANPDGTSVQDAPGEDSSLREEEAQAARRLAQTTITAQA